MSEKGSPGDLRKLTNIVVNGVVKKKLYDKLAIKVNAVDTKIPRASGLITKTRYDSDK